MRQTKKKVVKNPIVERIIDVLNLRSISQNELIEHLGLGNGAFTRWKYDGGKSYMKYIDEANEILNYCSMMGIYPVNPYESFVLMCLLTEEPLSVYNDVWEMSYKE